MENFLLDTCVISELPKKSPNQGLVNWVLAQNNSTLFISSITLGEIQKGITKLPDSAKKQDLQTWLDLEVRKRFEGKVIAISVNEALQWGGSQGMTELKGRPMPILDGMIAATAIFHNMTLVTRNVKDVEVSGVKLLNPWV